MFMLVVCGEPDCVHPRCANGTSAPSWYPNGPSVVNVLPIPVSAPMVKPCSKCVERKQQCFGHYLNEPSNKNHPDVSHVPSVVINSEFARDQSLSESKMKKLAAKARIDPKELSFQWKHLEQVKVNRARGVETAKKTRATNKAKLSSV